MKLIYKLYHKLPNALKSVVRSCYFGLLKSVYSGKLKVIVNEDDGFYTAFEILSD